MMKRLFGHFSEHNKANGQLNAFWEAYNGVKERG